MYNDEVRRTGPAESPLLATVHTAQQWTAELENSRITHLSSQTVFLGALFLKTFKDKNLFLKF